MIEAVLLTLAPVGVAGYWYLKHGLGVLRTELGQLRAEAMPDHGHRALEDRLSAIEDTVYAEVDAAIEAEDAFVSALYDHEQATASFGTTVTSQPAGAYVTANRDFLYGPDADCVCRRGVQYPTSHPAVRLHPSFFN